MTYFAAMLSSEVFVFDLVLFYLVPMKKNLLSSSTTKKCVASVALSRSLDPLSSFPFRHKNDGQLKHLCNLNSEKFSPRQSLEVFERSADECIRMFFLLLGK
mmetsp:Transcript_3408/g.5284  ORF Transcript_3408/g.5284 Transcript_3408/m.5284 type:complete len:102 (-) Transcript_3408:2478-2783(-)